MINIYKLIAKFMVVIAIFSWMLVPAASYADVTGSKASICQGIATASGDNCDTKGSTDSINTTIAHALNILSVIAAIAAVVMIMIAGFRFILSGGDSNNVASAKNSLIYAVVGLIVVLIAQVIVLFVSGRLF